MIQMPPRHGKSEFTSKYFPAWALGNFPDNRIILASYGSDLARGFGRKARDLLEQTGPLLFGVDVADDSSAADRWDLKGHDGGMVAVGVGGPITGRGADIAIIDDPLKNQEEAQSQVIRDKQWDWYQSTLYTRLEPGGAIILIMTRWHEDDLAGRLIEEEKAGGDRWTRITLPALAEDNDQLGREPGEPLWPERFDTDQLERIKQAVGPYVWSALYQQRPAPPEGNIFHRDWWQWYDDAPVDLDEVVQSWDMAFKNTQEGSYVVGQAWGRRDADFYLLDQVRQRMNFPATILSVVAMSNRWPKARLKLVEDQANGPAVIATLRRQIAGLVPVQPQGGKEARAAAVAPYVQSGNVYLPRRAAWINDFLSEATAFPNAATDDQVDAMSQALLRLEQSKARKTEWRPDEWGKRRSPWKV